MQQCNNFLAEHIRLLCILCSSEILVKKLNSNEERAWIKEDEEFSTLKMFNFSFAALKFPSSLLKNFFSSLYFLILIPCLIETINISFQVLRGVPWLGS